MTIAETEKLPDVAVTIVGPEGQMATTTHALFGATKAVLFSVPGAFTPTCSARHVPGYIEKAEDFRGKGVGLIACVSVNDAFVMEAWAKSTGAKDAITMIADGNGTFIRAVGLDVDQSERAMGLRAMRSAMIVDDCVVQKFFIEPQGSFGVSSAENVLSALVSE